MFMLHHNRSITVVLQQSNIFAMPWMHREYNFGGAPPFVVLLMCSLAGGLPIERGRGLELKRPHER
jgi:hypothetical protein